ncbi:MAG: cell wall hydrolase [Clostridiales bacterium]|nr:cell wall hydrolase [Clostridiales bacterium]
MAEQNTFRKKAALAGILFVLLFLSIRADASAAWTKNSNGTYSWYSTSGKLARNKWIKKKYYVNSNGIRVTGLQKIGTKYYYFHKKTGKLICGTWIRSDSKYYYAKKNGVLYTNGIKKINGSRYYFNAKGVRQSGKRTVNGNTYYFSKKTGRMVTAKWVCIGNKYYYFADNGIMQKNTWIGLYYVNSKGIRVTDSWKDGRYLGSDGVCVSGLQKIGGKHYYFDTSTYKAVVNTTVTIGIYTYSFDSTGVGTLTHVSGRELATIAVEDTYYTDDLVDDETLLAALIFCEAGNQSYTGQLAVGLVVLNRLNSTLFAASTLREVVYEENQFAPAANGRLTKALEGLLTITDSCKAAAAELLTLNEQYKTGITPTLKVDGEIIEFPYLFFMTLSAYKSQGLTAAYVMIGDHVFLKRWK